MVRKRTNSHCVLCYKPATSRQNTENRGIEDAKFIHLFSRYLKVPLKPQHKDVIQDFLCCEDCSILVNSFSNFYSQLECIRLQVDWKVRQIYETMKCAGRVPSRIIAFREQFEEDEDGDRNVFNGLKRLRTCLIKNCKMKLKSSQPRVHLAKIFEGCNEMSKNTISNEDGNLVQDENQERLTCYQFELLSALMITYLGVLHLGFPIINSNLNQASSQNVEMNLKVEIEEDAQVIIKLEPECQEPDLTHYDNHPEQEEEQNEEIDAETAQGYEEEMEIGEVNIKCEEIPQENDGDEWMPSIMNVTGGEDQLKTTEILQKKMPESGRPSASLRVLLKCDRCSRTFPNQARMDVHMSFHEKMGCPSPRKSLRALLKCQKCAKTFSNRARMEAHIKSHDEEEDSGSYCGSPEGDCEADVEFQMDVDEPDEEECLNGDQELETSKHQDNDENYELTRKEEELKTASGGKIDDGDEHTTKEDELETSSGSKPDTEIIVDNDKLKCELCHKILDTKEKLFTHTCSYPVDNQVASSEFQCVQCGKVCQSTADLERHHESTHISRLTCTHVCADETTNASISTPNAKEAANPDGIDLEMIEILPLHMSKAPKASDSDLSSIKIPMDAFKKIIWIKKIIEKHLRDDTQDKNSTIPFDCDLCFQKFKTTSELDSHQQTAHHEQLLICGWCTKAFPTSHLLEHHYDFVHAYHSEPHQKSSEIQIKCEECKIWLDCKASLEKHRVLTHHRTNFVHCYSCPRMFSCHSELLRHRTNKQLPCFTPNAENLMPAAAPRFPFETEVQGNKFCPAEGCYEVFSLGTWLAIHLKTHGKWKCSKCPQEFSKAHDFAWHELTKPPPDPEDSNATYKCTRCKASCNTNRALMAHFLEKHLYTLNGGEEVTINDNQTTISNS